MPSRARVPSALVAAVVGALALVLVVVLVVRSRADDDPERRPTLVLGDSVSFLSVLEIVQELGEGTTQVVARPGYRSIDLLPILREELDGRGDAAAALDRAVLLVGYNDVQRETVDAYALEAMVRETERFRCAVWLELPARPGGEPARNGAYPPDAVDAWNERIRAEAEGRDGVHVSDAWAEVVEGDGGEDLVQGDGVHPTPAGRRALAEAMRDAVADAC